MFYENSTLVEQSYTTDTDNNSPDSLDFCWYYSDNPETNLFTLIIISIWLPLVLVGVYGLYSQVQRDHVVPVYIINLLMSDVVQICCMVVFMANVEDLDYDTYNLLIIYVYSSGVTGSIFFMTLLSLERYLLIVWPLWYRSRRTTKASVSVSVVSWVLSICIGSTQENFQGGIMLISLPFLIFFLVQTLRALSAAQGVPADEKRRSVVVLVFVLLTYVVSFLPQAILMMLPWDYIDSITDETLENFLSVSCTIIQINPLANIVIYFSVQKWAIGKLLSFICCRKNVDKHQHTNNITTTTCSGIVSQRQNEEENNL